MNPKDIMICDILMAHLKEEYFPVKIDGIVANDTIDDGNSYCTWSPLCNEYSCLDSADDLDPIKITNAILEKNEFRLYSDGWYVWSDGIINPKKTLHSYRFSS